MTGFAAPFAGAAFLRRCDAAEKLGKLAIDLFAFSDESFGESYRFVDVHSAVLSLKRSSK
jgi:hypothetical protein